MLIVLVSAKGSPGVTTAALALAASWPRTVAVVDADPSGGDFTAGIGRGTWPPGSTLLELAAAARTTPVADAFRRLVVRAGDHAPLALAGIGSAAQAATLPWAELADGFRAIEDGDVLCDGGRYVHVEGNGELLHGADRVVLVTLSNLRAVRATARLVDLLQQDVLAGRDAPALLVVDPGRPYAAANIAAACGLPLLGTLPDDPDTAAVWSEGDPPVRGMAKTPLTRAARRVAATLATASRTAVPR
jgi:hypothetical protein